MSSPDPAPTGEHALLSAALARHVRRRAALGIRRLPAPGDLPDLPAPSPAAATPVDPAPAPPPTEPVRPDRAEAESQPSRQAAPARPSGPAVEKAPQQATSQAEPPAAPAPSPDPAPDLARAPKPAPAPSPAPAAQTQPPAPAAPEPTASAPPAMPPPPAGVLSADEIRARAAAVAGLAAAAPDLVALEAAVAGCTACGLCATRTKTVFQDGEGSRSVLFLGEAPGEQEDRTGVPFVGPAGQLLTDIIEKGMGLERREVSIANVLKCRPPGNRDPSPAEKAICKGWLRRQIELLDPRILVPLGKHASGTILRSEESMGRMRGRHERGTRIVIPTYHPSYLLRTPAMKKETWKDVQLVMAELGLPPS